MRSAFGDSLGSGTASELILWPSRGKMRISSPPSAASRASMGTSRRQSDDHSSEITSTLAGPFGCDTIHCHASRWASVSRAASNALWRKSL